MDGTCLSFCWASRVAVAGARGRVLGAACTVPLVGAWAGWGARLDDAGRVNERAGGSRSERATGCGGVGFRVGCARCHTRYCSVHNVMLRHSHCRRRCPTTPLSLPGGEHKLSGFRTAAQSVTPRYFIIIHHHLWPRQPSSRRRRSRSPFGAGNCWRSSAGSRRARPASRVARLTSRFSTFQSVEPPSR